MTVPPQSREALAVRAVLRTFGGKPLTPALEAFYAARHVAGLDRIWSAGSKRSTPTGNAPSRACAYTRHGRAQASSSPHGSGTE